MHLLDVRTTSGAIQRALATSGYRAGTLLNALYLLICISRSWFCVVASVLYDKGKLIRAADSLSKVV